MIKKRTTSRNLQKIKVLIQVQCDNTSQAEGWTHDSLVWWQHGPFGKHCVWSPGDLPRSEVITILLYLTDEDSSRSLMSQTLVQLQLHWQGKWKRSLRKPYARNDSPDRTPPSRCAGDSVGLVTFQYSGFAESVTHPTPGETLQNPSSAAACLTSPAQAIGQPLCVVHEKEPPTPERKIHMPRTPSYRTARQPQGEGWSSAHREAGSGAVPQSPSPMAGLVQSLEGAGEQRWRMRACGLFDRHFPPGSSHDVITRLHFITALNGPRKPHLGLMLE